MWNRSRTTTQSQFKKDTQNKRQRTIYKKKLNTEKANFEKNSKDEQINQAKTQEEDTQMRANEFISEQQKLDEVLPLVVGAGRGVGTAAKTIGKVGAIKSAAQKAVGRVGQAMGATKADPQGQTTQPQSTIPPDQPDPKQAADINRAKTLMIQPGKQLPLPTQTGSKNFKVSKVQGDEVEIENPDALKNPTQPKKIVYKKDDLKRSLTI